MNKNLAKIQKRNKRKMRIRKTVLGEIERPRISVFRSNKHIYAQIIDDINHKTLASGSDKALTTGKKTEKAKQVGLTLAEVAKKSKVKRVVFDRNGYKFHGRVKALAEGLREGGLEF